MTLVTKFGLKEGAQGDCTQVLVPNSQDPKLQTREHPAPFPVTIAERLVKLFSFAGDTVLDPFVGTGSTMIAALQAGRHSIGNEIEPKYANIATKCLHNVVSEPRCTGAVLASFTVDSGETPAVDPGLDPCSPSISSASTGG